MRTSTGDEAGAGGTTPMKLGRELFHANSVSPNGPLPLGEYTRASVPGRAPSSRQTRSAESFFCFQKELSILWWPLLSLGILLIRKIHESPTHLLTKEMRWSGDELTQDCCLNSGRQSGVELERHLAPERLAQRRA